MYSNDAGPKSLSCGSAGHSSISSHADTEAKGEHTRSSALCKTALSSSTQAEALFSTLPAPELQHFSCHVSAHRPW